MSSTLFRPKASSRANRVVWTKNPQEGTMYMDNNTTLDQQSLPWTMKSTMKVVNFSRPLRLSMDDLHMSMDDLAFLC